MFDKVYKFVEKSISTAENFKDIVTSAEAELDAQISVLGVKALAQLEKLIAKM